MSDEQREQQHEQVQVAQAQPEQPQNRWGDDISEERQRELLGMLEAWDAADADHGERTGPFAGVSLTGRTSSGWPSGCAPL